MSILNAGGKQIQLFSEVRNDQHVGLPYMYVYTMFTVAMTLQVEIVMGLEEAFGISVEEESAQTIATVQDAADLIEKLVETIDG